MAKACNRKIFVARTLIQYVPSTRSLQTQGKQFASPRYGQLVIEQIPQHVLAVALRRANPVLIDCTVKPISGSSGAATAGVARISGTAIVDSESVPFSLVRKQFRPLSSGRHAQASTNPRHWAYWRRELLAYEYGIPSSHGISAPTCLGIVDDVLYIEDVRGVRESAAVAARRLGQWQAHATIPDAEWLSGHQLAQRIAASNLKWSPGHHELKAIWDQRDELLAELESVPRVLVHGDFSGGHIVSVGTRTVVLDWGTMGIGPVGADLAHLALGVQKDLLGDYLAGLDGRFGPELVRRGYRVTLQLTGVSRIHWMIERGIRIPDGYVDFVLSA